MVYLLCPVCRQCSDIKTCECEVRPAIVDQRLLQVADMLMDLGFRVHQYKVYEVTRGKMLAVKLQLKAVYPEALFTESRWQIKCYKMTLSMGLSFFYVQIQKQFTFNA